MVITYVESPDGIIRDYGIQLEDCAALYVLTSQRSGLREIHSQGHDRPG